MKIAAETQSWQQCRAAQAIWAATSLRERVLVLRRARESAAVRAAELARLAAEPRSRPVAEVLTSEVLPLLEACRFIERNAERLLATEKLGGKQRPLWLHNVEAEIRREPFGLILVIGASNYPLLLAGVQAIQALAAGNAVLLKPGRGGGAVANSLRDILVAAGLLPDLLTVLDESAAAAEEAITTGVDKIILTGSADTGRAVLNAAAERLTPVIAELSGCDAFLIREDADLDLATRALLFGLRLNGSATCIAPRRVFVARRLAERLEAQLASALGDSPRAVASSAVAAKLRPLLSGALDAGATLLTGSYSRSEDEPLELPLVLTGCRTGMQLLQEDVFAPVLSLVIFDTDEEAVAQIRCCSYALGAAIFSRDTAVARQLGTAIPAGFITINDVIFPTADPRLPFGGRRKSGFGVTRGCEGLLEMTQVKVITTTRGRSRPHFDPPGAAEEQLFLAWIDASHGRRVGRWRALRRLWSALTNLRKH
jgi:acyl-CoA reductase-like NAD-dependent aldehyde dehydrogenase